MFKKRYLLKHITSSFDRHTVFSGFKFSPRLSSAPNSQNDFIIFKSNELHKTFSTTTIQYNQKAEIHDGIKEMELKHVDSIRKMPSIVNFITVKTLEQVKQRQVVCTKVQKYKVFCKPLFLLDKDCFSSFEYRSTGVQNTISTGSKNLLAYKRNLSSSIKKQQYSFITIIGGSGSGKTRAAKEVGNILRTSKVLFFYVNIVINSVLIIGIGCLFQKHMRVLY